MTTPTITHDPTSKRFYTNIDGQTAFLSYLENGDTLTYNHTVVPDALGGRGIGSALVQHALNFARDNGKKVIVKCAFVTHYINNNPNYQSLVVNQ